MDSFELEDRNRQSSSLSRIVQKIFKMIAATSRPIKGLMVLFVIILIYSFQPFTGSVGDSNSPTGSKPWVSSLKSYTAKKLGSAPKAPAPTDVSDAIVEPHEGGPRVRQATMIYDTDKFNPVYERSVDGHIAHGKMYDVPTHVLRHDVVDAGFFNKPAFLLGLVIEEMAKPYGQRADWIIWFDADTIILNPNVPWTIFFPPAEFDDIHILGSQDQNGFNAGMIMLRVHNWTVKMLAEVVALRQLRPEVKFEFFDQGAIKWVNERPGYEEHMIYQPHDWWNAFGLSGEPYNTDRFMLHFAGVDCCGQPEKKTTVMGRWLDMVENNPEKHTKPLANTTYPAAVEEYWTTLKAARGIMQKADKWKEETKSKPEDLKKAQAALKELILRHADEMDKVKKATKTVAEIIEKPSGTKSGEDKKTEDGEKKKGEKKKDGEKRRSWPHRRR